MFCGDRADSPTDIIDAGDGVLISMASSSSSGTGNKTSELFTNQEFPFPDYWLVKLDYDGNIVWQKTYGIYLETPSLTANMNIFNNMISDIYSPGTAENGYWFHNALGIALIEGKGYKIYNNSVSMTNDQNRGISTALMVFFNVYEDNSVDLRNNILSNTQSNFDRYAIYSLSPNTVFSHIDYNNYFSTGNVGNINNTNAATLSNWQLASGKDSNSYSVTPNFMSLTNLHLQTCSGLTGVNVGITTDIDNEPRNYPTIGADEIEGIPHTPSLISGIVQPCAEVHNQPYSIPAVAGATTYIWSVPSGWSIPSGNGTNNILVNTGIVGQHGDISVTAANVCGNSAPSVLAVTLPGASNQLANQCR